MTFHDVFQRDSLLFTAADPFQDTFRQIHVLQILQVFEDGFTDIVGFGAPGTPRVLFQALFDGLRKSKASMITPRYTGISQNRGARRTPRTAHPITSSLSDAASNIASLPALR